MITKELQATLSVAVNEAIRRRHEYVTLEHLLFALLDDGTASNVIVHCGGDVETLRKELEKYFVESLPPLKNPLRTVKLLVKSVILKSISGIGKCSLLSDKAGNGLFGAHFS